MENKQNMEKDSGSQLAIISALEDNVRDSGLSETAQREARADVVVMQAMLRDQMRENGEFMIG